MTTGDADPATRRPRQGRRVAPASDTPETAPPTILIAGVVHHVDRLQPIAGIARARLRSLMSLAVREPPQAIVVGTASPASAALEVIGELKRHERVGAIPVLHVVADDAACGGCGAELCLPSGVAAPTLVSAVRLLLRLRREGRTADTPDLDQRLLALGRVAGGIVHDFNNLLLVMTGHVELTRRLLGESHPAAARLEPALNAGARAGALTRQLLAFGRPAPADARLTDVGAVLAEFEPMLRGMLGPYVRVELRAGRGLAPVRVEPSRIEQLLLNLVVNARDAMPDGGRLTIEARDVEIAGGTAPPAPPGRYVMLAVSDEGVGMDAATREHMFEPFFTTKPAGEGSGLGLVTVQQVVSQAGGSARVDSEPGLGTTVRVYLPCAAETAGPALVAHAGPAPCGRETVLVAEGSEPVREVTRELLEELGYTALVASNAEEVLRLAGDRSLSLDLVLADAAMPGLPGGALAQQLKAARPRARVLLVSSSAPGGLQKPYSRDQLARAVRAALDLPRE